MKDMNTRQQSLFRRNANKRGASVIEYVVLIMMITGAIYVMKDSISRAIFAKFKSAGDSYAYGRQYDAKRSTVCKTDPLNVKSSCTGDDCAMVTYDEDCYVAQVQKDPSHGGVEQCYPGDDECYNHEDSIKKQCPCKN